MFLLFVRARRPALALAPTHLVLFHLLLVGGALHGNFKAQHVLRARLVRHLPALEALDAVLEVELEQTRSGGGAGAARPRRALRPRHHFLGTYDKRVAAQRTPTETRSFEPGIETHKTNERLIQGQRASSESAADLIQGYLETTLNSKAAKNRISSTNSTHHTLQDLHAGRS